MESSIFGATDAAKMMTEMRQSRLREANLSTIIDSLHQLSSSDCYERDERGEETGSDEYSHEESNGSGIAADANDWNRKRDDNGGDSTENRRIWIKCEDDNRVNDVEMTVDCESDEEEDEDDEEVEEEEEEEEEEDEDDGTEVVPEAEEHPADEASSLKLEPTVANEGKKVETNEGSKSGKRSSRRSPPVAQQQQQRRNRKRNREKDSACEVCGKRFYATYLKIHMRRHTGEKPFSCPECGQMFRVANTLRNHLISQHGNGTEFQCDVCDRTFSSKSNLKCHRLIHTNEKPYRCNSCGKEFRLAVSLTEHQKTHSDEFPYKCQSCSKQFRTKMGLQKHKERHHDRIVYTYPCHLCDKSFSRKTKLNDHINMHLGQSRHLCEHCGRPFVSRKTLLTHLLIHEGKKPFLCQMCGKSFRQSNVLKLHMTTHTGIKPFRCEECGKQFIHRVYLVRHKCPNRPPGYVPNIPPANTSGTSGLLPPLRTIRVTPNTPKIRHPVGYPPAGATGNRFDVEDWNQVNKNERALPADAAGVEPDEDDGNADRKILGIECQVEIRVTSGDEEGGTSGGNASHHPLNAPSTSRRRKSGRPKKVTQCNDDTVQKAPVDVPKRVTRSRTSGSVSYAESPAFDSSSEGESLSSAPEVCMICLDEFPSKSELKAHQLKEHPVKKKCRVCKESFSSSSALNEHIKKLHPKEEFPFKCEPCNKQFRTKMGLQKHKERHHDGIVHSFPCHLCDKSFSRKTKLNDHINMHLGQSRHLCEHCGRPFVSRKTLLTHLLIHEGKKPFLCQICGKSFRQSNVLKLHMTTHTGVKPFRCDDCGKQFIHRVYLVRHKCPNKPLEQPMDTTGSSCPSMMGQMCHLGPMMMANHQQTGMVEPLSLALAEMGHLG